MIWKLFIDYLREFSNVQILLLEESIGYELRAISWDWDELMFSEESRPSWEEISICRRISLNMIHENDK